MREMSNKMIKVLIVDHDHDWADRFASNAFSSDKLTVVGIESTLGGAVEQIVECRPDLVLVDQSVDNGNGIRVLEKLLSEFSSTHFVFTMSGKHNLPLWRSAMSKGAAEVVFKEYTINQILDVAAKLLAKSDEVGVSDMDEIDAIGGFHEAAKGDKSEQRLLKTSKGGVMVKQEIITVYSPKGGVGKTTIACNIACALAANKSFPLRVCLVDLDVSFGGVMSLMNLEGRYSVLDWDSYHEDEFDGKLIDQLVVKHSSGVDVIPAPSRAERSALINRVTEDGIRKGKEIAEKLIKVLRNYYDMIIIDVGPSLRDDSTITVIESSTRVLIVGVSDVPTLRNIMSCQKTFDNLEIDQSKMRVVLNRVVKNDGLDAVSLRDIIPYVVIGKIPEDAIVRRLANEGKMLVLDAPNTIVSKAMLGVSDTIVPIYNIGKQKKQGFFQWLLGMFRA